MFGANELCLGTQNEMPPLQQGNPRSTDPTGSCQDHDKKKGRRGDFRQKRQERWGGRDWRSDGRNRGKSVELGCPTTPSGAAASRGEWWCAFRRMERASHQIGSTLPLGFLRAMRGRRCQSRTRAPSRIRRKGLKCDLAMSSCSLNQIRTSPCDLAICS